jgi:hypothetical protein
LVSIGLVLSEEKIFEKVYDVRRSGELKKLIAIINLCLRNKSWKPECVGSCNMDWGILVHVFYPEPEARDTIY